jgi:hypothetical protein
MGTNREPHVMVTWANAITTGQRVTECFASRDEALREAGDRSREQWNNTRVTVAWHEPHNRARARQERSAAHSGSVHVWGVTCRECAAISADRDDSAAHVEAARDAAGDSRLHAVTS